VSNNEPDPVAFEISDELDLHTFRPSEIGDLVPDYIGLAIEQGYRRVRIIHGKGIGTLRTRVHAILECDSRVERFELAGSHAGGWGATIAWLQPSIE
jgi:dsDNA-specific endonuclease/ATPase MutS2